MRMVNKRLILKMMLVIGAFILSIGGVFAFQYFDHEMKADSSLNQSDTNLKEEMKQLAATHINPDGSAKRGDSHSLLKEGDSFMLGKGYGYSNIPWKLLWDYGDGTGLVATRSYVGYNDNIGVTYYSQGKFDSCINTSCANVPYSSTNPNENSLEYDSAYFASELYDRLYWGYADMNTDVRNQDIHGDLMFETENVGGYAKQFYDSVTSIYDDMGKMVLDFNLNMSSPFLLNTISLADQLQYVCPNNDNCIMNLDYVTNANLAMPTYQVGFKDFEQAGLLTELTDYDNTNFLLAGITDDHTNQYVDVTNKTISSSSGFIFVRFFLFINLPYDSLTTVKFTPSFELKEGDNANKDTIVGELSLPAKGPFEMEIMKDDKTSGEDHYASIDAVTDNQPLSNEDIGFDLSDSFVLKDFNETTGKANLVINDSSLAAGTYYVKVKAKDKYEGDGSGYGDINDEKRTLTRIIKIVVAPAQSASDNAELDTFEFQANNNLRVGIDATAGEQAGEFVVIPDGYTLTSAIVAGSNTTSLEASYFSIQGTGNNAKLMINTDLIDDKTYHLRVYLIKGTDTYFKDISVTIQPGYPLITSLGYESPYTLTYGDASIIPTPTASIGTANITLSEADDGNSPYTFDLIDDATYPDNQYFEVDSQGAIKYTGTTKLSANTNGYTIKVEVTDSHGQKKSEEVKMIVNKATQKNYAITNTGEIFVSNKTIPITTSGKESDSTGAESFEILEGKGSVASISGTNQYQMLSIGTFKLEATIAEDANYLETVVTKEIELSDLPAQTPAISITSSDEMTYGTTYTPAYIGGQGNGSITWSIDSDNGTGAVLNNGKITVSNVGTFTLKVVKAGSGVYQDSEDSIVVTVNPLAVTVKPNNVSIKTGQAFTDQGVMYTPNIISGDASKIGTPVITTAYKVGDGAGAYDITITGGLANPNYTFTYTKGTLTVSDVTLPDNGDQDKSPYYTVTGTKGKNGWYTSDIKIKTTGKDGYTKVSQTNGSFTGDTITVSTEGEYDISLYFQHTDGTITKPITYKVKIDKTAPSVPTMTVDELNTSRMARLINLLSFGSWMNEEAQVTMLSSDPISGIDYYEYVETIKSIDSQPKSSNGTLTYGDETELMLKARACDKAGNCSTYTNSEELKIDKKGPTILGVKDQSVYKQYYIPRFITIEDLVSGPDQATYTKDDGTPIDMDLTKPTKIAGEGTYTIEAIDVAQNISELTFKIIPFPDIKTEIDGSDESKEIIDQIQEELDEVKNQLEPDEVKDYEKWIEDATDWWESLRKKVVETDDKSAKVEGIGDTSFDPKVELIVDPITENDVPTLPRKAISIYDVYLKKGEQEILPNGEIKVYLPYTEDETPIIYEIDDDGTITEITGTMEDGFATFHTTVLKKYAISNTKQEENKDPDDNENQKPTPNPDDGKSDIDSDGDGANSGQVPKPDVNIDFDCDGEPDINLDTNNDGIPDINIDTNGDGKPNYNVDLDGDQIPDLNIGPVKWETDLCKTNGCGKEYCTSTSYKPYLNIDTDDDLRPDVNVDLNKDKIADINIDVDGDYIPDIEIDSDGNGVADINLDTNGDGRADTNLAIIKEWIPDKDVNEPIKYDTMSNIQIDQNLTPDIWQTSKEHAASLRKTDQNQSSMKAIHPNTLDGVSTGDPTKVVWLWILCILCGVIGMITKYLNHKFGKRN